MELLVQERRDTIEFRQSIIKRAVKADFFDSHIQMIFRRNRMQDRLLPNGLAWSNEQFLRRIRLASAIELAVYMATVTIYFLIRYVNYISYINDSMRINKEKGFEYIKLPDLSVIFFDPILIILLLLLFVFVLWFLLTGQTPIVTYFVRLGSTGIVSRLFPSLSHLGESTSSAANSMESGIVSDYLVSNTNDIVKSAFESYIKRSQLATKTAQGRPNALLFIGGIIAFFGLIFFFLTLPGSKYGFFASANADGQSENSITLGTWSSIIQIVPRLLMLAFIQILAGFFLRQYRAAMEDFRYYEAVLRYREAQFLAYLIRSTVDANTPKGKSLLVFSSDLMREREFGILRTGQTTMSLASLAGEQNEMATFYEKIADIFSTLASKAASFPEKKKAPKA
jgi:hypothetical protein